MPLLGDLIRYSIENKRRKKEREAFLAQFKEQEIPASELAAILGGVGQSNPLGMYTLPYAAALTGGVINQQNAKLKKAKDLVRSGFGSRG